MGDSDGVHEGERGGIRGGERSTNGFEGETFGSSDIDDYTDNDNGHGIYDCDVPE